MEEKQLFFQVQMGVGILSFPNVTQNAIHIHGLTIRQGVGGPNSLLTTLPLPKCTSKCFLFHMT